MTRRSVVVLVLPALAFVGCAHSAPSPVPRDAAEVVHVAPPAGETTADRASILAAVERVLPGGTIQFAPGTYLMGGEIIRLTTPRVTLLGHPEGTVLRGCHPDVKAQERDPNELGERCNLLELAGAQQTVRSLTFEHAFWALHVGCCWESFPYMERGEGGHLIEGNTFRSNGNAVRVHGAWTKPSIIRDNRFRNNWHSVAIYGNTVHLLDNDISALEPEEVPGFEFPWDAVGIGPSMPIKGSTEITAGSCANNVVARNRIEGKADGITIDMDRPGDSCRNNQVRDNTIIVSRVRAPSRLVEEWGLSEPTFIGTPLALLNYAEAFRRAGLTWTGGEWSRSAEPEGNDAAEESFLEDNVIEGNRIIGAEGLGMEILYASRNRIANNTFTAISPRDPFPGNFFGPRPDMGVPLEWGGANGSGIWVSAGSDENEIVGNLFEDIAAHAVVLEGDGNRVETRSAGDPVRDLGRGNRVSRLDGASGEAAVAPVIQETGFATGADGVRLFYRIEGQGPDTVVVLHGGPALGLAYLAADLEPLGREHALLFYDQRGVGRSWSESDVDLSADRHVEDLEALRIHFGIGRLLLVGHSWGAMLAARYAAAYPDRVERMLFIDPMVPAKTPYEAEAGSRARRGMQERLDSARLAVLDSLVRVAPEAPDARGHCRSLFDLLVPLYFPDPAAAHRSRGDFCAGSDDAIRARSRVSAAIMGSLDDDVRPLLSRVRSPVLIVHGGSSAIPAEAMHAWEHSLADARLMIVPDAGHYLHVDRPDVFFPAALEFLGGSWPAGAETTSRKP